MIFLPKIMFAGAPFLFFFLQRIVYFLLTHVILKTKKSGWVPCRLNINLNYEITTKIINVCFAFVLQFLRVPVVSNCLAS